MKKVNTYRGSCEGLQEELYLKHLQSLVNDSLDFNCRIDFKIYNIHGGYPKKIVEAAIKHNVNYRKGSLFSLYDYDFKDQSFIDSINYASENNLIAAYSIVNFNLFLILNKVNYNKKICKNDDCYEAKLKEVYNIEKKENIKSEKTIKKILKQIDLKNVYKALERCKKINAETDQDRKQTIEQPYFQINSFLEKILQEAKNN